MSINREQAERLIQVAAAKAEEMGVAATIVVMDASGHLKALSRMDGAWLGSIDVAIRKARTSVLFEMETQVIWEFARPDGQAHGIEFTNDGLVTFAGGIPLRTAPGGLIGSIGVSGGQVAQDYAIAQAGAEAGQAALANE